MSKYSNIYDVKEWSEEAITMKAQGYSKNNTVEGGGLDLGGSGKSLKLIIVVSV